MRLRFQPRSILTLFFIGIFTYIVADASDMPFEAKLYPWTIGLLALVLLAWQAVRELFPSSGGHSGNTGADIAFTAEEGSREGRRRALELFGWLYGFVGLLWLIGFYLAVPAMVCLYLLRHRERPATTALLSLGAAGVTWLIFGYFLHLPFPPGLVIEYLGLA